MRLLRFARNDYPLVLLLLAGCDMSTRDLPANTSDVAIEIDIEHETRRVTDGTDWDFTQVKAELKNAKGKAIEKAEVRLVMNGEPLQFVVGVGNYYDRHPYYRASDEQVERLRGVTECTFEIVWPDGTRHPVGRIATPARLSIDQFTSPRMHTAGQRLAFGWKDVTSRAEVVVYRGLSYTDTEGNQVSRVGTPEEAAVRKTIGPGLLKKKTGEVEIPAEFFAEQPGDYQSDQKPQRVVAVYVDVIAATSAPVTGPFLASSRIRATRKIEFYIEVSP